MNENLQSLLLTRVSKLPLFPSVGVPGSPFGLNHLTEGWRLHGNALPHGPLRVSLYCIYMGTSCMDELIWKE